MSTLPLFGGPPLFDAPQPKKLRPYQQKAIQTLRDRVRQGRKRILLVAPTGAGKMTLIASIIRTSSVRVLFVCDSMELVDQCVLELAAVGISNVGVMRGDDDRTDPDATVQICSIQTLTRRNKPLAGLVLIDEAHLSASPSYVKHIFEHYTQAIIIGFTATPTRLDGEPLGDKYECLEVVCTYEQLIKDGFIAEPLVYGGPVELDLSMIKTIGGDYDEAALGDIMRKESLVGNLLQQWRKLAHLYPRANGHPGLIEGPYRRTFGFAVNIQHSMAICERFAVDGVRVAHLDGNTSETERKRILKAISVGELDVVTNVGVLLKGVDVPSVKCVIHARPTQSIVVWRQSCGRILRPWHPDRGHPSFQPIVIDHANNIARHGFPHEDLHWELHSRVRSGEKKAPTRICQGCYAYLPAHKRLCPYCGADSPPPPPQELPKENEEQLQALSGSPEEMKLMYFNMISQVARAKGYKPGFAGARYKSRYGAWPPWEWSEMLKSSFASDPVWQANFAENEKRREKVNVAKMAKELAKIEEPDDE